LQESRVLHLYRRHVGGRKAIRVGAAHCRKSLEVPTAKSRATESPKIPIEVCLDLGLVVVEPLAEVDRETADPLLSRHWLRANFQ